MTFKVGDEVVVKCVNDGEDWHIGKTGTITNIDDGQYNICINAKDWFASEELRYLTKLDKVLK